MQSSASGECLPAPASPPPEIFVCPISRELMHDPVVLIETGQIYDRASIVEWFRRGNNTCPLTGNGLVTQSVAPVHSLRNSIQTWAKEHQVDLESPDFSGTESGAVHRELGSLDNPSQSLSLISGKGISVYDIQGLFRFVGTDSLPEAYAAMVLLRDLVRFADAQQLKQVNKVLEVDMIKALLWEEQLQVPAARLLVQMKGALDMEELLSLLVIQDADLQVDVLTRLVEHICESRGHVHEFASALKGWMTRAFKRLRRVLPRSNNIGRNR